MNNLPPKKGFFWNEYSEEGQPENGCKPRKYFTPQNASKIDAIREQILAWRSEGVDAQLCDLFLHDLILASNKVANIAGTFGYYKANYCNSSLAPLKLKETNFNKFESEHIRFYKINTNLLTFDILFYFDIYEFYTELYKTFPRRLFETKITN